MLYLKTEKCTAKVWSSKHKYQVHLNMLQTTKEQNYFFLRHCKGAKLEK